MKLDDDMYNKYSCWKPSFSYDEVERYWRFLRDAIVSVFGKDKINVWTSICRGEDGKTYYINYVSVYNGSESIVELLECLVGKDLIHPV